VLSFPTTDPRAGLGDIIIAFETAARDAKAQQTPLDHHLAHLTVHGFLHLLGYDHEDADEADSMERLETAILAQLGIADPYGPHDAGA
jgi:probable rRNA maturation factor